MPWAIGCPAWKQRGLAHRQCDFSRQHHLHSAAAVCCSPPSSAWGVAVRQRVRLVPDLRRGPVAVAAKPRQAPEHGAASASLPAPSAVPGTHHQPAAPVFTLSSVGTGAGALHTSSRGGAAGTVHAQPSPSTSFSPGAMRQLSDAASEELPSDEEWARYTGVPVASTSSQPQPSNGSTPARRLHLSSVSSTTAAEEAAARSHGLEHHGQALGFMAQVAGGVALAVGVGAWGRWLYLRHLQQQQQQRQQPGGADAPMAPSPSSSASPSDLPGQPRSHTGVGQGGGTGALPRWDDLSDPLAPFKALLGVWQGKQRQPSPGSLADGQGQGQGQGKGQGQGQGQGQGAAATMRPLGPEPPPAKGKRGAAATPAATATSGGVASDPDWWRSLDKVHYVNFGAGLGILPSVSVEGAAQNLPGPGKAGAAGSDAADAAGALLQALPGLGGRRQFYLVGFEDAADAEYVAATLKVNMEEAGAKATPVSVAPPSVGAGSTAPSLHPAGPRVRYTVLPGSPAYLEDLARLQSWRLGVVPSGILSRSVRLSDAALSDLLAAVVAGRYAAQQGGATAGATGGATTAGAAGSASSGAGASAQDSGAVIASGGSSQSSAAQQRQPDGTATESSSSDVSPPQRQGGSSSTAAAPSLRRAGGAAARQQPPTLSRSNFKFEFADFDLPASRLAVAQPAGSGPKSGDAAVDRSGSDGSGSGSDGGAAVTPAQGQGAQELTTSASAVQDVGGVDRQSAAEATRTRGGQGATSAAASAAPEVAPLPSAEQAHSQSEDVAPATAAAAGVADGGLGTIGKPEEDLQARLRALEEQDRLLREAQRQEEERQRRLRLQSGLGASTSTPASPPATPTQPASRKASAGGRGGSAGQGQGQGQGQGREGGASGGVGGEGEEPLREDEKQALLSEWYALMGTKPGSKRQQQQGQQEGQSRQQQGQQEGQRRQQQGASNGSTPAPAQGGPAATGAAKDAKAHATQATPRGQADAAAAPQAKVVQAEVMSSSSSSPSSPAATAGGPSREEEDEYVAAVLRNLDVVTDRVREAERKLAEAAARARAGDQAAKLAQAAAEAQLAPLREQLEQLEVLRQSLEELSGEGQAADASAGAGGGDWVIKDQGGRRLGRSGGGAPPPMQVAEFAPSREGDAAGSSSSNNGSGSASAPASTPAPAAAAAAAAAAPALTTPLPKPSVIPSSPSSSGAASASKRRSWGAWGANKRIRDAEVSLIRKEVLQELAAQGGSKSGGNGGSGGGGSGSGHNGQTADSQTQSSVQKASGVSSATAAAVAAGSSAASVGAAAPGSAALPFTGTNGHRAHAGTRSSQVESNGIDNGKATSGQGSDGFKKSAPRRSSNDVEEEEARVTIVSQRAGTDKAPKRARTAEERQATVKEALRFAAAELNGDDADPGMSRLAGGTDPWWRRQFQALWLPSLVYADGSMGFVQLDVSMVEGRKDMRVLAFEDRHDASHCMAVLKQWPEYDWCEMQVQMMPTKQLEETLQEAFDAQDENKAEGRTPPSGVVVFRRGKLPLRVGMPMEEFTQIVVYQAAAQASLARVGYDFSD